jgi:hypothetical protein
MSLSQHFSDAENNLHEAASTATDYLADFGDSAPARHYWRVADRTTALYKLLSMDEQFQGVEFWLGNAPMLRRAQAGQISRYIAPQFRGSDRWRS